MSGVGNPKAEASRGGGDTYPPGSGNGGNRWLLPRAHVPVPSTEELEPWLSAEKLRRFRKFPRTFYDGLFDFFLIY